MGAENSGVGFLIRWHIVRIFRGVGQDIFGIVSQNDGYFFGFFYVNQCVDGTIDIYPIQNQPPRNDVLYVCSLLLRRAGIQQKKSRGK